MSLWTPRVRIRRLPSISQSLTVRSVLALMIECPSGATASQTTGSRWPSGCVGSGGGAWGSGATVCGGAGAGAASGGETEGASATSDGEAGAGGCADFAVAPGFALCGGGGAAICSGRSSASGAGAGALATSWSFGALDAGCSAVRLLPASGGCRHHGPSWSTTRASTARNGTTAKSCRRCGRPAGCVSAPLPNKGMAGPGFDRPGNRPAQNSRAARAEKTPAAPKKARRTDAKTSPAPSSPSAKYTRVKQSMPIASSSIASSLSTNLCIGLPPGRFRFARNDAGRRRACRCPGSIPKITSERRVQKRSPAPKRWMRPGISRSLQCCPVVR